MCVQESFDAAHNGEKKCWAAHLLACLSSLGVDSREADIVCGGSCLNATDVWEERRVATGLGRGDHAVRDIPDAERDGFKRIKYMRWFADEMCDVQDTFWFKLSRP